METLGSLFAYELRDIYSAEKQIVKALPIMARAASNPELENVLKTHLTETEKQIERLERIFQILNIPLRLCESAEMNAIIEEGRELLEKKENWEPKILDAALIAAVQRVDEYESAAYDTLFDFADLMGYDEVVNILEETLDEQKKADEKPGEIDYQPVKRVKRL